MADALYLQENVGAALTAGLASCASAQPDDPVDYLAHWLLKYLAVQDKKELAKEADAEVQKQRAVLERVEEEKVQADAARLHKLNEAKKAIEACTNIPKFYKAIDTDGDGDVSGTRAARTPRRRRQCATALCGYRGLPMQRCLRATPPCRAS